MNKCECDQEAILFKEMAWMYDKETELPFVSHVPHECKCVNNLRQYWKDGKKVFLCSNCVMEEEEVKEEELSK